jgi:HAD superfamily hydrolase (TIGR01509 family)
MRNEHTNFKKLFGILFDLDGTLVDNEHLKGLAFAKAIEQLGGKSHPSIYKEVMGMSGQIIRNHFMNKANIQIDLDEYLKLYKANYDALLETDLALKPGVIVFLSELKDKGIKMAVVSGAYSSSVFYIINSLDLNHYFDFILTGDDVKNKKPNPESYFLALDRMNLPKKQVIVFEDTESGLKAAENAGLKSIGIRHSYNQSHDLSSAVSEYVSYEDDIEDIRKDINSIFNEDIF